VQLADQVPDDVAAIAGQRKKAGPVVHQGGVVRRALAGRPAEVPQGIMSAAIFTESSSAQSPTAYRTACAKAIAS
jgi:hypothetical protein